MNSDCLRQQILCLKYQPNNYRNQCKQEEIATANSTVMLAQRLLKEYKQTKFQVRKVSVVSPHSKLKTFTIDSKRFHMYSNKNSKVRPSTTQLNVTANTSFYSKKSVEKLAPPVKPKTALSRPRRVLPLPCEPMGVTAQSWCIVNGKTGECVAGSNHYQSRQMASITKIMTCWLTLRLVEELHLDLDSTIFTVPDKAERIGGTSAQLQAGDKLNIRDLLYGLMLPSGNDAAVTLMHNFADYGIDFVNSMNGLVATLGLESTQYANPHGIQYNYVGLFHEYNYSSAHDIGKLTYQAMQNIQFASVVRTKIYFSEIEDKFGEGKEVFWENTNKMLYNGYRGVKTGITKEAGPCVVEYYEDKDCSYLIVLLNCRSVEHRWLDASRLLEWIKL